MSAGDIYGQIADALADYNRGKTRRTLVICLTVVACVACVAFSTAWIVSLGQSQLFAGACP